MILIKTKPIHLPAVIQRMCHATDMRPRHLHPGDEILIQRDGVRGEKPMVVAWMKYNECVDDVEGLSERYWPECHWCYLIRGHDMVEVNEFNITEHTRRKNYARGAILYTYIDPDDARDLRAGGFLNCKT